MKILILNGSPKGKYSVTLQTSLYLEIKRPKHEFRTLHVGQRIRALEKDFSEAKEAIEWADLLVFSYPVYTFIAPSQLHRFIELLKESDVAVEGKFATQITTSKHFYDVTAHGYIQDNCQDMGMKFIRGLSADMDDLTTKKGQREARAFFDYVCWQMKHDIFEPVAVEPAETSLTGLAEPLPIELDGKSKLADTEEVSEGNVSEKDFAEPQKNDPKAAGELISEKEKPGDVVIVADLPGEDKKLAAMIEHFRQVFPLHTRVVNLREYPFKGGCLGCFRCAVSGKCIYTDGFDEFLRNNIQTAQATVYAFSIRDHSMGALFKMFDDRQFCNGHRTVTMGKPVGYLVSGNYSEEFNLQMVIEGRAQVGGNFLAGVAADEVDGNRAIDRMAESLNYVVRHKYVQPQNFYGVGGMKIFRDLIYLMRGMMKADHEFYKSHGQYDFPQKQKGRIAMMYLVGGLMSSPKVFAKMGNKINEGMLMPYQKVLKEAQAGRAESQGS